MRRMVASLVAFLLIGGLVPAAAQTPAGAELVRGAGAMWWRHDGNTGTLYFVDVYEYTGTYFGDPHATRGFFGTMPCEVGRRNRPADCHFRKAEFRRVKVSSFEIDPLLDSAHAVVRFGDRRGEVTWSGRGDYNPPFMWESVNQFADPPYFAALSASAAVYFGRDASARGDLFGLGLTRKEFLDAGMGNFVFGGAGLCAGGPWC
jgi:hypothetical protein